jgi:hypothetical protein
LKLLVDENKCNEIRDSFVALETQQRIVVGLKSKSPLREKVLESINRVTYNKFVIYKLQVSEKVLNVFKCYL